MGKFAPSLLPLQLVSVFTRARDSMPCQPAHKAKVITYFGKRDANVNVVLQHICHLSQCHDGVNKKKEKRRT